MNRHREYLVLALMLTLSLMGCSTSETTSGEAANAKPSTQTKPVIAATNFALQSMAKAIVGDFADVIRPQVQSSPQRGLDTEEVIAMQNADVVLTNGPGANDAAWLDLISLNESRVVATTSDEFELSDFIQVEDYRTVHSHGDEGEHSHPWLVPHCWLNPRLAHSQSLSILNRLIAAYPDQKETFSAHHKSLKQELQSVEALAGEVAELIQARNLTVIASDPRLLFFTRSLKLDDNYLLWFELPEASAAIDELEKRKPGGQAKLVLLCAQETCALKSQLEEATGAAVLPVSLIESAEVEPDSARDYIAMLRENYQRLKSVAEGMTD